MSAKSARQTIKRLYGIRNRYGEPFETEKSRLLDGLSGEAIRTSADAARLHLTLSFLRAFPDSERVHRKVSRLLDEFGSVVAGLNDSQRAGLIDSGIATTEVHYAFSYEVASWLARRFPGVAMIDWPELHDSARLDELLDHLLHHAEADFFDSGEVTTAEWIDAITAHQDGTDFDWLMTALRERRHHLRFWMSLYNAAEVPLRCRLGETSLSKTRNVWPVSSAWPRNEGMQNRVHRVKQEIAKPIPDLRCLDARDGRRQLDIAMASLAVRHRETIHFNHASDAEVWVADVGRGVTIAAFGLSPEFRYPLETTMGFLISSNGVPIGYGGASMLFRQANTGINIFEEFRGSEAAWLWVQVMRTFHAISGCTRFIANPYQFGAENTEALKSGAFWFYYRLGYRPVDKAVRQLAAAEARRIKSGYRTPVAMLRRLAACDMHLILPAAKQSDFFDERFIETSSLLATRQIAATGHRSRRRALHDIGKSLAVELGIEDMKAWSRYEREWFLRLAPIVAAASPARWPRSDKSAMTAMLKAKGGRYERDYIELFSRQKRFIDDLKSACRGAMSEA